MAENHLSDNVSAIKEQLKKFLNFNAFTTELLLRFVEKLMSLIIRKLRFITNFLQFKSHKPHLFFKINCATHST